MLGWACIIALRAESLVALSGVVQSYESSLSRTVVSVRDTVASADWVVLLGAHGRLVHSAISAEVFTTRSMSTEVTYEAGFTLAANKSAASLSFAGHFTRAVSVKGSTGSSPRAVVSIGDTVASTHGAVFTGTSDRLVGDTLAHDVCATAVVTEVAYEAVSALNTSDSAAAVVVYGWGVVFNARSIVADHAYAALGVRAADIWVYCATATTAATAARAGKDEYAQTEQQERTS